MSEYTGAVYTLNQEKTANDITSVEKENNAQAIGETYYDLSGRKLSEPTKGVTIKTIKYSDGTQKAVKSISK